MAQCAFDLTKSAQLINKIMAPTILLVTFDVFCRILSIFYMYVNMVVNVRLQSDSLIWFEILQVFLFTKTLLGPTSKVAREVSMYLPAS